jgi:hypothetical protein
MESVMPLTDALTLLAAVSKDSAIAEISGVVDSLRDAILELISSATPAAGLVMQVPLFKPDTAELRFIMITFPFI